MEERVMRLVEDTRVMRIKGFEARPRWACPDCGWTMWSDRPVAVVPEHDCPKG